MFMFKLALPLLSSYDVMLVLAFLALLEGSVSSLCKMDLISLERLKGFESNCRMSNV